MKRVEWFYLAVKYWLQGDSWRFAREYACAIVYGFKELRRRWEHE